MQQCRSFSRARPLRSVCSSSLRRAAITRLERNWSSVSPRSPRTRLRCLGTYRFLSRSSVRTSNVSQVDLYLKSRQNRSSPSSARLLLEPDNLFHRWTASPIPAIRQRAAFIKRHAYCPHPDHHPTRLPVYHHDREAEKSLKSELPPAHVDFECPDCGIPVYCCEKHWAEDYESHLELCETLREINEDDHDLRSGRFFPEFEYAGPRIEEALVNFMNWDTFLYTRDFQAIDDERSLRQATRTLTYPATIGSVLSELSPYNIRSGGRLTPEGLKSFSGRHRCQQAPVKDFSLTTSSSTAFPSSS